VKYINGDRFNFWLSYAVDELQQLNPSGDICLATVDAFGAKSETL